MKTKYILLGIAVITSLRLFSQGVGIGSQSFTPDNSAALEIKSNAKGLLIPRLTSEEKDGISDPAEGLLIYQTDEAFGFYYYSGSDWYLLNDRNNDSDTDDQNEFQTIELDGNTLSISNGNSVQFQTLEIQEYQRLSLREDTLEISNGNYVIIPLPDDLGSHTASQNIQLNGMYLSGDGDNEGIRIDNGGTVTVEGVINLGTNAVQTSEISNGAITTAKIGDDQVTLSKIGNDVPLGFSYKGGWNASTNTPTLTSSNGANSDYYTVAVAGTINIGNGVTSFDVGDWVIYNGSNWVKLNNTEFTESVNSVFGRTGVITAEAGDYTWNQIDKTSSTINDVADVTITTPIATQLLIHNGTSWRNRTVTGDVTMTSTGITSISPGVVTPANLSTSLGASGTILSWNGSAWTETLLSTVETDGDITNELITGAALVGTELQITDAGQTWPVDLSTVITDDQTLLTPVLTGTTLTLEIEDGNDVSVDLLPLVDDADPLPTNELITNATLVGTELRITDAGQMWPVDLSAIITDDQNLTSATLLGTVLTINIEDGDPVSIDLAALQDGVDDADPLPTNELITNATLVGTELRITDAGQMWPVDLSSLSSTGTDDQNLGTASLSGTTLTINIEDGNSTSVDLAALQDGTTDADADATNELITDARLTGDDLRITDAGQTWIVDLSSLSSGGTDDQNLGTASLSGTTLTINIENGNPTSVDLAALQDGTTDADADATNELITGASLSGSDLRIIDAGQTWTVDLSSLSSGGTDDQNLGTASLSGTTLTINIEDGNPTSVDLAALQDGTTDADADATNELITNVSLSGDDLQITDAGQTWTVNLASTSDRRLKENFKPTKYGIDNLMRFAVLDYDFIDGKKDQTGLIAQDLYEIYPSAVVVGGDDIKQNPWRIKYDQLTPILVKSTQELNTELNELKQSNEKLKDENQVLKERLDMLESKLNALLDNQ